MKARRYELTDKEWELVQPLIPISHTGRPQKDTVLPSGLRTGMELKRFPTIFFLITRISLRISMSG